MDKCSICNSEINCDEPAILTMGAYGNPRYICEECSQDLDTVTLGKDVSDISSAMERIGKKMAASDPDKQTYTTVTGLMAIAHDRAQKIKSGEYDFSLDESLEEEDGFDEIPEELAESEEDKEKDRIDEEKQKRFDKFYNYALIGVGIGAALFIIWKIVDAFLL